MNWGLFIFAVIMAAIGAALLWWRKRVSQEMAVMVVDADQQGRRGGEPCARHGRRGEGHPALRVAIDGGALQAALRLLQIRDPARDRLLPDRLAEQTRAQDPDREPLTPPPASRPARSRTPAARWRSISTAPTSTDRSRWSTAASRSRRASPQPWSASRSAAATIPPRSSTPRRSWRRTSRSTCWARCRRSRHRQARREFEEPPLRGQHQIRGGAQQEPRLHHDLDHGVRSAVLCGRRRARLLRGQGRAM